MGERVSKGEQPNSILRMAAHLAPLLTQIWHKGSAGPQGASSGVLAPLSHGSR